MKSFLLVLCVALSVVGCNSSKNMAKLSGVKWVLQTLNDKELSLTDPIARFLFSLMKPNTG